jgi:hypothetical protein
MIPNEPWFPPLRPAGPSRLAKRTAYPYAVQAPGTGTLAPFTVSIWRPERQGA